MVYTCAMVLILHSRQLLIPYMPARMKTINSDICFHALVKYDVEQGVSEIHDFGRDCEIGEIVFAPNIKGKREEDGFLMLFIFNRNENSSDFVILDAANIKAKPLAKIRMPRRIPNGLHGTWFPEIAQV